MDKNKDLLPDYFRFVKGLIDSSDLSLNISREMLQHDRQLKKIASAVESKIRSELEKLLKNDREKYEQFYKTYGINLKYGVYDGFGANKDKLQDLILFKTTQSDGLKTLKEYINTIKDDQKFIYYASGKTKDAIQSLPQMDLLKQKDYEVLLLTDEIDEFMINILQKYEEYDFKSITQGDLDLLDDQTKEEVEQLNKDHKKLLKALQKALKDQVKDVTLSTRLTDSPVCIASGEGVSLEMEKILQAMPNSQNVKADRILEINPKHELFTMLEKVFEKSPKKIDTYASLLYNQALLIEGMPIENPVDFSNKMVELMIESNK
jgi:molecular chaperone HtpG